MIWPWLARERLRPGGEVLCLDCRRRRPWPLPAAAASQPVAPALAAGRCLPGACPPARPMGSDCLRLRTWGRPAAELTRTGACAAAGARRAGFQPVRSGHGGQVPHGRFQLHLRNLVVPTGRVV